MPLTSHFILGTRKLPATALAAMTLALSACGDGAGTATGDDTASSERSVAASSDTGHLPYYDGADFTPLWLTPKSPELADLHTIPAFSFTNQNGEQIDNETYDGKIYVASFFFATCPGICSTITTRLQSVQQAFADNDNVRMISHSITPEADTVEVLRDYADTHQVQNGKWDLITGERAEIFSVAQTGYFADEDLGEAGSGGDFLHTDNVLLIDGDGRIRGIYSGMSSYAMFNLIDDIKLLEAELPSA